MDFQTVYVQQVKNLVPHLDLLEVVDVHFGNLAGKRRPQFTVFQRLACRGEIGVGDVKVTFRIIAFLLRGHGFFHQLNYPLVTLPGIGCARLRRIHVGHEVPLVQLGQQIAAVHVLTFLDGQLDQSAGDFKCHFRFLGG